MVKAKFVCTEVSKTVHGTNVQLMPVTGGSKENEEFFKWTPSGKIEMGILNDQASEKFIPGKQYFVTFEGECNE